MIVVEFTAFLPAPAFGNWTARCAIERILKGKP
jgi:hypothetical protein